MMSIDHVSILKKDFEDLRTFKDSSDDLTTFISEKLIPHIKKWITSLKLKKEYNKVTKICTLLSAIDKELNEYIIYKQNAQYQHIIKIKDALYQMKVYIECNGDKDEPTDTKVIKSDYKANEIPNLIDNKLETITIPVDIVKTNNTASDSDKLKLTIWKAVFYYKEIEYKTKEIKDKVVKDYIAKSFSIPDITSAYRNLTENFKNILYNKNKIFNISMNITEHEIEI